MLELGGLEESKILIVKSRHSMWKLEEKYDVTAEMEIGNMHIWKIVESRCQRQKHSACRGPSMCSFLSSM
jgi:hypothetical protein